MNLNKKKLIAKELLVFLSCILIFTISFLGIYPYNYIIKLKENKLKNDTIPLTKSIKSLEKGLEKKLSIHRWFYDKSAEQNALGNYKSYSELWDRLEYLQNADSIIFKWNNIWGKDLIKVINNIGFNTADDFNKFIKINSFNKNELKTKLKVDSLRTETIHLKSQIKSTQNKIINNKGQLNFALIALTICFTIAYPIRLIIYSIKWSVKILKQKE